MGGGGSGFKTPWGGSSNNVASAALVPVGGKHLTSGLPAEEYSRQGRIRERSGWLKRQDMDVEDVTSDDSE
jgi:hypothetical protein